MFREQRTGYEKQLSNRMIIALQKFEEASKELVAIQKESDEYYFKMEDE